VRSSRGEGGAGSLFELEGVHAERGGIRILHGIDLELAAGATALVGPSGAGKSTLLRLLNRLADPVQGSVRYRGEDVRGCDPQALRREVCLVPQLPALLEGTVADNIHFAAELAGREPDVGRLLELAGLGPSFAERDAARLSVGEQQRAMLARALALEPRVLLLDEPTSALDPEIKAAVEGTLRELRRRLGISLILVTHDLDQARRMSEWLVRIEDGRAVAAGPTSELLAAVG